MYEYVCVFVCSISVSAPTQSRVLKVQWVDENPLHTLLSHYYLTNL